MIELRDVSKVYKIGEERVRALDHANLHVYPHEFVSIIGPSGSGKSTLMNIIGCLDTADDGQYLLDGTPIDDYSENELAQIRSRKIGFVFQSFFLLPKLDATENVMVPLLYRGIDEKLARSKANEVLEKMGLGDRTDHLPSELSGGQQQRVAIARALVGEPELILADEPTGALDSKSGRDIVTLLKDLNEKGQTIILITHDMNIAREAKRIVSITDGCISEMEVSA